MSDQPAAEAAGDSLQGLVGQLDGCAVALLNGGAVEDRPAGVAGGGTLSSSDGQRFPTKGKSLTARALSRYFADQGLSTYTHITDQHAVYGTKVIVATDREAPYVLDEILGNATDVPITEHATDTDTHGASLLNFACSTCAAAQLSGRSED